MSAVPETTAAASAPEQAANALKQRLRRILRNVSGPVKVQLGILANLHAREANIRVDTELQKLEAFLVVHFPTEMENDVDISSDAMVAKITELGTQLVASQIRPTKRPANNELDVSSTTSVAPSAASAPTRIESPVPSKRAATDASKSTSSPPQVMWAPMSVPGFAGTNGFMSMPSYMPTPFAAPPLHPAAAMAGMPMTVMSAPMPVMPMPVPMSLPAHVPVSMIPTPASGAVTSAGGTPARAHAGSPFPDIFARSMMMPPMMTHPSMALYAHQQHMALFTAQAQAQAHMMRAFAASPATQKAPTLLSLNTSITVEEKELDSPPALVQSATAASARGSITPVAAEADVCSNSKSNNTVTSSDGPSVCVSPKSTIAGSSGTHIAVVTLVPSTAATTTAQASVDV